MKLIIEDLQTSKLTNIEEMDFVEGQGIVREFSCCRSGRARVANEARKSNIVGKSMLLQVFESKPNTLQPSHPNLVNRSAPVPSVEDIRIFH